MAVPEQSLNYMGPDKTFSASYKDSHDSPSVGGSHWRFAYR